MSNKGNDMSDKMGIKDMTVIMHISDLHFGIEKAKRGLSDAGKQYRKTVLENFKKDFCKIIKTRPNLKPDILVVSGDISYGGLSSGYADAMIFLTEILDQFGIKKENVILCFGNHDVDASLISELPKGSGKFFEIRDRELIELTRPDSGCSFQEYFNFELDVSKRYHRFLQAEKFCRDMDFKPLENCSVSPNKYNYTYGFRNVEGIDFFCLNTEWDYWGAGDKKAKENTLRIGSNICLEILVRDDCQNAPPRFIVFHRQLKYLHPAENILTGDNTDRRVGNLIYRHGDVSLNGHDHISTICSSNQSAPYLHTTISAGAIHTPPTPPEKGADTWEFSCNLIFVPKQNPDNHYKCKRLLYKYQYGTWVCSDNITKEFFIYRYNQRDIVNCIINLFCEIQSIDKQLKSTASNNIANVRITLEKESEKLKRKIRALFAKLKDKPLLAMLLGEESFRELNSIISSRYRILNIDRDLLIKKDSASAASGGTTISKESEKGGEHEHERERVSQ